VLLLPWRCNGPMTPRPTQQAAWWWATLHTVGSDKLCTLPRRLRVKPQQTNCCMAGNWAALRLPVMSDIVCCRLPAVASASMAECGVAAMPSTPAAVRAGPISMSLGALPVGCVWCSRSNKQHDFGVACMHRERCCMASYSLTVGALSLTTDRRTSLEAVLASLRQGCIE
jgi:hypothetical protein